MWLVTPQHWICKLVIANQCQNESESLNTQFGPFQKQSYHKTCVPYSSLLMLYSSQINQIYYPLIGYLLIHCSLIHYHFQSVRTRSVCAVKNHSHSTCFVNQSLKLQTIHHTKLSNDFKTWNIVHELYGAFSSRFYGVCLSFFEAQIKNSPFMFNRGTKMVCEW